MTNSAFCQARKKLKHTAFIALNDELVTEFYREDPSINWRGYRLLAVDGSTLRLPSVEPVLQYFGQNNGGVPLAKISQCVDIKTGISRNLVVSPYATGEQEMAVNHLPKTGQEDLILYDRGYCSFFMFALHRHHDRHFCMRLPVGLFTNINAFLASGKNEDVLEFNPTKNTKKACEAHNLSVLPIKLRVLKVLLSTGEIEILATTLLDSEKFPHEDFQELYHQRWGVEGNIKHLKKPLEIENFTGLSVEAILQDIYAKLLMNNIVAMAKTIGQVNVDEYSQEKKRDYKINSTQALSKAKNVIVRVILNSCKKAEELLSQFVEIISKCIIPIRPGRNFPRNHKFNKRVFYNNTKRAR